MVTFIFPSLTRIKMKVPRLKRKAHKYIKKNELVFSTPYVLFKTI